ncbi:MAG: hypothetical protein AAGB11_15855 [Pseudomonadota bacterium]
MNEGLNPHFSASHGVLHVASIRSSACEDIVEVSAADVFRDFEFSGDEYGEGESYHDFLVSGAFDRDL